MITGKILFHHFLLIGNHDGEMIVKKQYTQLVNFNRNQTPFRSGGIKLKTTFE